MPNKNRRIIDNLISRTKIYLFIIAVLLFIICLLEPRFVTTAILVFLGIILYAYIVDKKRKAEISNHIHELLGDVDSAAKQTLISSPFPLVILETDGNIIWKSEKFEKEFSEIDVNPHLDEIMKEIKQEIAHSNGKKQSIMKQIKIGKRIYKVLRRLCTKQKRQKR